MKAKKKHLVNGVISIVIVGTLIYTFSRKAKMDHIFQSTQINQQVKQQKDKSQNKKNISSHHSLRQQKDTSSIILKSFGPTSSELESFYERNKSLKESTLSISGLIIDRSLFQGTRPEKFPAELKVPLPDGGMVTFTRQHRDFEDQNSFVWVGVGTEKVETLFLSFYGKAVVGHIQTANGRYEIEHLIPGKQLIRLVDDSKFPELTRRYY